MPESKLPAKLLWLTIFPALQTGCFALAGLLVSSHPVWAVAWILASGLALNFTIHVCAHEFLHWSDRHPLPRWMGLAFSAVMGLTFDGYRLHHHNHHRHNNGPGDFSRTWRTTPEGPRPYGVWRYALGWPAQVARTVRALRARPSLSAPEEEARRRMRPQALAIAGLALVLALLSWKSAALYAAMVYVGWALVSLHNYGQHPPETPARIPSFTSRWYNRLFFNNGLHHEHHARPATPWHELEADPRAPRIHASHLVSPLRRRVKI